MDPMISAMAQRIEILIYPQVQLLDVAGPLQAFSTANDLARLAGRRPPYDLHVVAQGDQVIASCGLPLGAQALPHADAPLDSLLVPGGWGVDAASHQPALLDWIASRARVATRTVSVCSGAFLLAAAGLLDGRRAVTHWRRCEEFRTRFPQVRLETDPIFIRDGAVWTSAGVTAGIDLALALIEADHGRALALEVARQLVVFLKRPGGQSQFSAALTLQHHSGRFDDLHAWMVENLHRTLSIDILAERARMSARSFARHYQRSSGMTPAKALEEMRLEAARRLLEQGQPITRVLSRCGFGSEETLRRAFLRRFGVNPKTYRERFAI